MVARTIAERRLRLKGGSAAAFTSSMDFAQHVIEFFNRPVHSESLMVIVCPACGARYAPPENAITADGRMVRCSACRAEWRATPTMAEAGPAPMSAAPLPAAAPAAPPSSTSSAPRPSAMAASLESPPPYEPGGRGGFMAGFTVVALLALGGLAVYVNHAAVAEAVPALADPIERFVAVVDNLRARLAGLVGRF